MSFGTNVEKLFIWMSEGGASGDVSPLWFMELIRELTSILRP